MKKYNESNKRVLWDLSAVNIGSTFDGLTSSNEKRKIKEAAKKYVANCIRLGVPIICRQPVIKECLKEIQDLKNDEVEIQSNEE